MPHSSRFRLSLFNPHAPDHPVAERELALRMAVAAHRLGMESLVQTRSDQVRAWNPDLVLNLYPEAAPKLTPQPWLACYWNPPELVQRLPPAARVTAARNELTFDAYLVSGPTLKEHLTDLMRPLGREPPTMPFHPSSPRSFLSPTLGPESRLFYIGSNWDGRRFPRLLEILAEAGVLALHGTRERWAHLAEANQGPLPFDGRSVIDAAHRWGMGLCLHLPQHRVAGVPNMRVFELAAAGALIIADRNPFVEQWFGDTVIYVDVAAGEEEAAAQIVDQVAWARGHVVEARAMAAAAQDIFNRHLCLEVLLQPLPDLLAALERRPAGVPAAITQVAVLLSGTGNIESRLEQLAIQVRGNPDLRLVALVVPDTESALPRSPHPAVVVRLLGDAVGLPTLLAATSVPWLAVLPDGVEWDPHHLADLIGVSVAGGAILAAGVSPILLDEPTGFPVDQEERLALLPPDDGSLSAEGHLISATLRAGGLLCHRDLLVDLETPAHDSWRALSLNLVPALAETGRLRRRHVPSVWLLHPPAHDRALETCLRSLGAFQAPSSSSRNRSPCVAGIGDLDPALAASIPLLWHRADFRQLPPHGAIWLFGAGRGGELALAAIPAAARSRVVGFLDSQHRGEKQGLPLRVPDDLPPLELSSSIVIISSQYVSDIIRFLRRQPAMPALILNAYPYISDEIERDVDRKLK